MAGAPPVDLTKINPVGPNGTAPTAAQSAANSNPAPAPANNVVGGAAINPDGSKNPYAAPPAKTVGDLYGFGTNPDGSPMNADQAAAAAAAAKTGAYSDSSVTGIETKSRSDVLGNYQSELDALDQAAAEARARITTQFKPVAEGRVGESTASQARRGLLGSDFGSAQTDTVNVQNANELSGKIAASDADYAKQKFDLQQFIQGEADKESQIRIDASQKGADAKISEIQDRRTRSEASAKASIAAMLQSGVNDPTNPNYSDSINKIASNTGLTTDEVKSIFTDTKNAADATAAANKKAQADAEAAGRITVSPGQKVYDAKGNLIASVQPTDKFSAQKLTDGLGNERMVIFDTTTGKIVGYGDQGGGAGGGTTPTPGAGPGVGGASTAQPSASQPDKSDSHLPIAQTIDGKSFDKNGDPTSGNPAPNPGLDNTKVPFAQYGLLSKTDYNPGDTTDQLASLYLDKYIKSGAVPTASTMGRNIKPGLMAAITSRASDLYFKATGNPLPTPAIIKSQQDIISGNYKIGNNLSIQEGTVKDNVDLSIKNMTKAGLNSSGFKPLDDLIDNIKSTLQDPNVGQFVAQNSTIQNELGSLLAVKNAAGTTVYDKLQSAGIIQSGDAPEVIQRKVNSLLQEAGNFAKNLQNANATAYGFTDPLLMDPNNPARGEYMGTEPKADAGAGGGAAPITAPDGTQVIITD